MPSRIFLKNARLIDGTGAPARDGSVVIEGETIVHAGPLAAGDAPSGADTHVVDLAGRTVIPGLVEAHIHLSYNNVKAIADLDLNCPPAYSTLVSARNAELALSHGYTAARSAGSVHGVDVALKRAINEGLYPGPRLLAASRDIVATGHPARGHHVRHALWCRANADAGPDRHAGGGQTGRPRGGERRSPEGHRGAAGPEPPVGDEGWPVRDAQSLVAKGGFP
jgi:imidazolonepropionase-like amidohydrolase